MKQLTYREQLHFHAGKRNFHYEKTTFSFLDLNNYYINNSASWFGVQDDQQNNLTGRLNIDFHSNKHWHTRKFCHLILFPDQKLETNQLLLFIHHLLGIC